MDKGDDIGDSGGGSLAPEAVAALWLRLGLTHLGALSCPEPPRAP